MTRRPLRNALFALGLCILAACVVNLSFDMPQQLTVQSQGSVTSISTTLQVVLSNYQEIIDHKNDIKSLDLDSADVTVVSLGPTNKATKLNGAVRLAKSPSDPVASQISVGGPLSNFPIMAGSSVRLPGSPQLDAFLLQQLQNGGTFYVVVDGSIDQAPVDLKLNVIMHASLGYDTGIF